MSLLGGSSSKSATTQSQTGSQTQLGDPVSINASGNAKSNLNIKIQRVDYGSVRRSFELADKVLDSHKDVLNVANNFALDTVARAQEVSSQIIEAGQYSAGATERIAGAFEAFVDEQNNPNEKLQMVLIVAALAGMALVVVKVKK